MGGNADAAGGQAPDEFGIVEPDTKRRTALTRRFSAVTAQSRSLYLTGRDRLQNALDLAAVDPGLA